MRFMDRYCSRSREATKRRTRCRSRAPYSGGFLNPAQPTSPRYMQMYPRSVGSFVFSQNQYTVPCPLKWKKKRLHDWRVTGSETNKNVCQGELHAILCDVRLLLGLRVSGSEHLRDQQTSATLSSRPWLDSQWAIQSHWTVTFMALEKFT